MPLAPDEIRALIAAAREVLGPFTFGREFSAGTCAAAVRGSDRTFTGICIDLACGIGFCAEASALAEMLKTRETRVLAVVAVGRNGILPPCGRCREMLVQMNPSNMETEIIMSPTRVVLLRELLPEHWLASTGA